MGTAYATRTTTILDYAYIIFPVTNIGTETLCLIELTGITYRDAGDMELLSGGLTYVQGSVGKTPSLQFTDTCLAPGETGMVRTINNNLYAAVAKMEFTFSTIASTISVPAAKVIPQSYTIASSTLTIVAKNVGTRNALVGEQNRFHSWVLLDDAMHPLTFGLTNITTPSIIAPDGTATISTSISYAGSGSKLLVSTNFEDTILSASAILASSVISPTATAQCATSLSPDELAMCRIESRNRAIEALQTSAQ